MQPGEYLFCFGPSKDKTVELIKQFKDNQNVPVKILYDKYDLGTGYARKVLTDNAKGDFISWIDADDIPPVNWIESLIYLHNKYDFDGLEGETKEITLNQAEKIQKKGELEFTVNVKDSVLVKPEWLGRYGMGRHLLNRDVILKVGNFDEFFTRGQTLDLTYRLEAAGFKRYRCKQLKIYHTGFIEGYKKKKFYNNAVKRSVFLKLFYKYGFRSLFLEKEHTLTFLFRLGMVFSAAMIPLFFVLKLPFIFPIFLTILGLIILFFGVLAKYGFEPDIYLIQLAECLGEITIIYDILRFKNKEPFGYGKKYLTRRYEKD
jgi:glycosyltransferase involved in cell wall biosynthesis